MTPQPKTPWDEPKLVKDLSEYATTTLSKMKKVAKRSSLDNAKHGVVFRALRFAFSLGVTYSAGYLLDQVKGRSDEEGELVLELVHELHRAAERMETWK